MTAVFAPLKLGAARSGRLRLGRAHRAAALRALSRRNVVLCVAVDTCGFRSSVYDAREEFQRRMPVGCKVVHVRQEMLMDRYLVTVHTTAAIARSAKWPGSMTLLSKADL